MIRAYDGTEPFIFISYSHKDTDNVLPCVKALMQRGFRVWYDNGIEAGSEWPEYIAERMMSAGAVIAFMSRNAQDSHNCRREVNFAIELKKQLLVVYLEDFELTPGMRLQLGTLQAMFYYKSASNEDFFERLCRAALLESCLDRTSEKPMADEPAPAPAIDNSTSISFEELCKEAFSPAAKENVEDKKSTQEKPPKPKKAQKSRRNILIEACEECNRIIRANKRSFIFKFPEELKEKQLNNACRVFGTGITKADIIALLDDTIMSSGKSGILITEDKLISRQWLFPFVLSLEGISGFNVTKESYIDLTYTNGTTESYYFGLNRDAFLGFFEVYIKNEGSNH